MMSISIPRIISELESLLDAIDSLASAYGDEIATAHPDQRMSAANLLHYLALRQHDIRELQKLLAQLGLSRLGRAEAHVRSTIEAVLNALHALHGNHFQVPAKGSCTVNQGMELLSRHTQQLLGQASAGRSTRIMVTAPSEAAEQYELVRGLLAGGMNILRINCAHDDQQAWSAMIKNLRAAEQELGLSCKIYADLAGPKLRTGALPVLGQSLEIKVKRDALGHLQQPALVWLTDSNEPMSSAAPGETVLTMDIDLLNRLHPGDQLMIKDSRGGWRALDVAEREGNAWRAYCRKHAYIEEGAPFALCRYETPIVEGYVCNLPEVFEPLVLRVGDLLRLKHPDLAVSFEDAMAPEAAIACSLPEVFGSVKAGEAIWFDDGKIGGKILSNDGREILVQITRALPTGSKLGAEKGINLPDTELSIPALTAKDLSDLKFLADQVDIIGLSFVRSVEDVLELHTHLDRLGADHLATVLKIETRQGFNAIQRILLAAMKRPTLGIMVARGDLAVEIGFERLAEVQEEILWLCEAAHVPVIWATEVLDTMAKRGQPSRAEVSDAALSVRAECVMLNKGPYILDAVHFLAGILKRMGQHRAKGLPTLRRLSVSEMV